MAHESESELALEQRCGTKGSCDTRYRAHRPSDELGTAGIRSSLSLTALCLILLHSLFIAPSNVSLTDKEQNPLIAPLVLKNRSKPALTVVGSDTRSFS